MAQIMANDHQLEMRIQSEQDEIYASLRPLVADIERIRQGGFNGSADDQALFDSWPGPLSAYRCFFSARRR